MTYSTFINQNITIVITKQVNNHYINIVSTANCTRIILI